MLFIDESGHDKTAPAVKFLPKKVLRHAHWNADVAPEEVPLSATRGDA